VHVETAKDTANAIVTMGLAGRVANDELMVGALDQEHGCQ
jgi:hypothetical protein